MLHTESHILRPDAKGRITLGKLAEGISSFHVSHEKDGRIVLDPYMEIPAREQWLYKNKSALKSVLRGIEDSKAGRVSSLGSFKQYLELEE